MAIRFDCTECRSEISATGHDDKEDGEIYLKCQNCLANVIIIKERGEVKEIKIKGKKVYKGFTSGFNKYTPEDMNRIQ